MKPISRVSGPTKVKVRKPVIKIASIGVSKLSSTDGTILRKPFSILARM
ncbi:Uncharacterised protein [Vibrio cholerae]|nr:Uncharacterised protein [Vibrio cholerae]